MVWPSSGAHSFLEFPPSSHQKPSHRREYIGALSQNDFYNFWVDEPLGTQSDETVKTLYFLLKDLFTDSVINESRGRIIKAYLGIPQDQWNTIKKQAKYIMPDVGGGGHDLMAATEILCSCATPEFRALLVNTANRFFSWDTTSQERFRILQNLSKKTTEELLTSAPR